MSVASKLAGAFGFLALLLAGMMAYHITTTRQAVATSYELSAIFARLQLASTQQLDAIDVAASKYWVTHDPGYRTKVEQASADFDATLRRLAADSLTALERARLARLDASWQAFGRETTRFEAAVAAGDDDVAGAALATLRQRLSELDARLRSLGDASRRAAMERLAQSAAAARKAAGMSLAAIVVALLLGVLVAGGIVRSIARSLGRLRDGTREVAQGNFEYRIDAGREQELAQLAHDFNRMTERLGELERMKQDFLSKVSHDLKSPLASMQETTRILQDEVPGPLTPRQQRLLELSHQTGERLAAMIGKILDLSALEAGTIPLELHRTDLGRLASQAADAATPAAAEHGVMLRAELPAEPLVAECDAEQILRVLDNLLENAVKFSPRGSTVVVRATAAEADDEAVLSVRDAGPGVPDAEKERIFERFYQSASSRGSRGRGVGLGLTICREIVEAHRGAIRVSDAPAGGSVFSVTLPRIAGHGRGRGAQATPPTSASAGAESCDRFASAHSPRS